MNIVVVKFNIDRDLTEEDSFVELAGILNRNFLTSFRKMPGQGTNGGGVQIVVDPGEFFIKDSVSLAVSIIGIRRMGNKDNRKVYYYVNESIYQSFSHVRLKPSQKYVPKVLFYTAKIKSSKGEVEAMVYGYSDDENDILSKEIELPADMCNGDMLAFYGLGPYVKSFESDWMINSAEVYYFCSTEDVQKIKEWVPAAVINETESSMMI
jgi:diaminopimelate decarboxylase